MELAINRLAIIRFFVISGLLISSLVRQVKRVLAAVENSLPVNCSFAARAENFEGAVSG
jgi:hypothetical protein